MNPPDRDLDPELERLLREAFSSRLDVEVASSHLWRIHHEGERGSALDGHGDRDVARTRTPAGATPTTAVKKRPPRHARGHVRGTRRLVVLVLTFGMMLSMSGAAVAASGDALPGDALYPVKRVSEQAALLLTPSAQGRAELRIRFAQTRLNEILTASRERPDVVPDLWKDLEDTIETVAQDAPVEAESLRQQVVALAPTVVSETAVAGDPPSSTAPTPAAAVDAGPALETLPPISESATPTVTVTEDAAAASTPTTTVDPDPTGSPMPSSSPSPSSTPTATATPTSNPTDSNAPSSGGTASDSTAPPQTAGGDSAPEATPTPTEEASGPARPRPEPPEGAGREEPDSGEASDPGTAAPGEPATPAAPSGGAADAPPPPATEEPAPEPSGTATYGRPG